MQVDPIKPTLKAPGAKRLKLKCDELLSSFAFNFNLRRYTSCRDDRFAAIYMVGRCRLHLSSPS